MKVVTELKVLEFKCICPHCGEDEGEFCFDARGEAFNCDSCGEEYRIHHDADFEMI